MRAAGRSRGFLGGRRLPCRGRMPGRMAPVDVLIVSLGGTAGLREADRELAGSLRRAGASVAIARTGRARELRTFAAIEFAWAVNARRAATRALREVSPRA